MGRALRGVRLADADVGAARVRPGARRGRDGGRVAWAGAAGLAEPVPVDVLTLGPRRARDGRGPPRGDPCRGRVAGRVRGSRGQRGGSPAAPMPPGGVRRCASPTPSSLAACITTSSTPICSIHPASSTASRSSFAPSVVRWSSRGLVALSVSSPSAAATCSISCAPPSRTRCEMPRRASGSSARSPPTRRRALLSCCSTVTARSSFRAPTTSAGSPSNSGRPSIPAGCPGRLPSGWRCRRACRSSACAMGGASPSAC